MIDDRAKEFLSCLGNGKGRITEEDEDPNAFTCEKCGEPFESSNKLKFSICPDCSSKKNYKLNKEKLRK